MTRKQVQHLVSGKLLSERRACGLVGISRSVVQYNSRRRYDAALWLRLKELAERYPRYGYLMLHVFLKQEGPMQNTKRTYRLYAAGAYEEEAQAAERAASADSVAITADREVVFGFCIGSVGNGPALPHPQYCG